MKLKPIHGGWIALALAVFILLGAFCKVAAGDGFDFPRVLWYVPVVLLNGCGLGLAGILGRRARRCILQRRGGRNGGPSTR